MAMDNNAYRKLYQLKLNNINCYINFHTGFNINFNI